MSPRVHVVSVHWSTPDWIALQQREVSRHLWNVPVSYHLGVGGGVAVSHPAVINHAGFEEFAAVSVGGRHAQNLDFLIDSVMRTAGRDDLLMVLDQDAFPIMSLKPTLDHSMSTGEPLAAVRSENNGDEQPHPLFFVAPFEVWKRLGGTWAEGPVRLGGGAVRKDVGGALLRQLHDDGQPWVRLTRSADNRHHPVLYGVYGDLVYHHGAASRPLWTDADARRIYRNLAHRILDGVVYRMGSLRKFSLRCREQVRMAEGHRQRTEELFADPEGFIRGLVQWSPNKV